MKTNEAAQARKTLSVDAIKELLAAHLKMVESRGTRFNDRIRAKLGMLPKKKERGEAAFTAGVTEMIVDTMAKRLKRNRRSVPILSAKDFERMVPWMIDQVNAAKDESGMDPEDRAYVTKLMKAALTGLFKEVYARAISENSYDEYWRWIVSVLALAREWNVPAVVVTASRTGCDEVTRRTYTRKQFVANSKRAINRQMKPSRIESSVIAPMLDVATDGDAFVRQEFGHALRTELKPMLRETLCKSNQLTAEWLAEEADRIYGPAVS